MIKNYKEISGRAAGKVFKGIAAFLCLGALNTLDAQVLTPFTGSNSIACGTNTVILDHAGTGNYANYADGYTVIEAGAGAVITLSGIRDMESCCDFLTLYDGVGTGGTQLGQWTGYGNVAFTYTTNPGQTVTLRFRTDVSVVASGFSVNVSYSGPCVFPACLGTPASNTTVATSTLVCPVFGISSLSLTNIYTLSAISYSWQMSTQGAVGPYSNIANATGTVSTSPTIAFTTPTLNTTTWYQVALQCANGGSSITTVPVEIQVAATTTNTVPYFEGFENIVNNGDLPNCSWYRSDNAQCRTRTAMFSAWRQARTGNKFAEFDCSNQVYYQTRYYWSNGIQMNAGITYSASVWYNTQGGAAWGNLALMYGPNQTPTGLISLATIASPNQTTYQSLSNTFTVASSGMYYMAVRATENGWGSQLVWDDLQVIAPCQFTNNAANISLTSSLSICAGQTININASGAATYSWNTGSNANSISVAPLFNTTYSVIGINPLSGCTGVASREIVVNQLPPVSIVPFALSVCEGQPVSLQAVAANSYTWSEGPTYTALITVTPTAANNTYSVTGINNFGCVATAVQQIVVNPLPVVTITGNAPICAGYPANLTASGAGAGATYQWISNLSYLQSNPVSLYPNTTTTYSVNGISTENCKGTAIVTVVVDICLGVNNISGSVSKVAVYPNPNNGVFTVSLEGSAVKTIEVTDITGRVVLTTNSSTDLTDVNISELANGVYYVKVKSDNVSEVIKVVKQ